MIPMQWKPELFLGIEVIDDQHKVMIEKFSEVKQIVEAGNNWTTIDSALVDLAQVARRNFEFEESLMRLFGIPNVEKHKILHEIFFAKMTEIESSSLRGAAVATQLQFLYEWLLDHILVADRRDYAEFVLGVAQVVKSRRE